MDDDLNQTHPEIRFAWWNTSLSPPGIKSRSTPERLTFVTKQLSELRSVAGWDVLGLGEVAASDIEAILEGLNQPSLDSVRVSVPQGKAVNDTALIFNRDKLAFQREQSFYDVHGGRTLKAGHLALFVERITEQPLAIVVAHWPGRRFTGEHEPARANLGMTLHKSVQDLQATCPNVIVMGDFNDDPSSPSLARHLLATRDRTLAKKKNHMLYNPFWRSMSESQPLGSTEHSVCGTHYYSGREDSNWFTYDQILFSPALLSGDTFVLEESASLIVPLPELVELITSKRSIYDHYPVVSTIIARTMS
ncbi:endonuclease/exonuclease/phosphatase family protein [Luteibacter sp. 22Crub2.1]|uniref:endonuclease/exonuclease/phosphatase family protein n=1 Tax=Luteibacter sp. 22Crub2.1 TaxID=1283288 RepID=UPI0009A8996B|nr:endonuclease/exonuclease/phosphatase family protein [Luteibacter sp. 22Crub2.1]SKB69362.1 Endonuclease/Exonuclease/phosphatase family protein [Luteibacter sp. 22Crub2.1]